MKNKIFNNIRITGFIGALMLIGLMPLASQAQTTITKFHPIAGFIGDTIVITGTGLNSTEKVHVGQLEATFKKVNDTMLKFAIPVGAVNNDTLTIFDGTSTIKPQIIKEGVPEYVDKRIFIPEAVNSFEQIVFFEPVMDPFMGGSPGGGPIGDHETNNRFVNDDLTFSGTGSLPWATKPEDPNYNKTSGAFGIGLSDGDYFQIDGINTVGLENVRLSFALAAWYAEIQGGVNISYSEDNGANWVSMGGVSEWNLNKWVFKRIAKTLPSVSTLSLKFEFNQPAAGGDIIFDDIRVTGFPAGVAVVSEYIPNKAKPGKELLIKGSSLGDIKTVRFIAEDDSNIEVTDLNVADGGESITLTVPQGVKTAALTLINSKGVEFPTDDLTILDASPKVTKFNPSAAPIGGLIKLEGEDLYNITSIAFGNVDAPVYFLIDDTRVDVYVPAGAVTSAVKVESLQGSFDSGNIILDENDTEIQLGDFSVDNSVPLLTFTLSETEAEEGQTVSLVAKLTTAATQAVKLDLSFGGSVSDDDYKVSTETAVIVAGSVESDPITITIVNEGDNFEDEETLEITMIGSAGPAVPGAPRTQSITIKQAAVLSVKDELKESEIVVYQNMEGLNVLLKNEVAFKDATAVIYDLNGSRMYLKHFNQINGKLLVPEVNQYKPGVYVLMLANYEGQLVRKFIVK
ncbi:IPT/TIG domain-containing protein [Reichenbachiella carrageenanivorans]|uniref:IPT/TIG domain-containing protein n=1 Tax=Reichenbachiella carrageenanivorans TaxID=2979869 RepID=A0ABY6D4B5_9BACT|nr:IPT/TIG domain-containing protein [Reichenbachiella carrageenanivorans]UXX81001.1 IPT/TIG domain-containing protein [Reichenbachiella carrageenanivorans]